jgi:hypothetical protein
MPVYFFNIKLSLMTIVDQDGIALATAAEAIKEARIAARAMAAEVAPDDDLLVDTTIEVLDEAGRIVEVVGLGVI